MINQLVSKIRRDVASNKSSTHKKLSELGLINLMEQRMPGPLPKTWNRGKTAIDHVYMTVDVNNSVRKAGYAPFNVISMSDHRGVFFDLDMSVLFDEALHATLPAQFRRLQSSDIKRIKKYNELLKKSGNTTKLTKNLTDYQYS